jgi:phage terminase large subunit-like protein
MAAKQALPHVEAMRWYVRAVLSGDIPACKWVKRACERYENDLREGRFSFDDQAAERACKFISLLPHTKGKWAKGKNRLKLEPWQSFVLCQIFGWKRPDGTRRFREAYIEVPRKNAKSTIAAGIGLKMFAADGEYGAEVYSGATSEKQAWEVFRPARLMAQGLPEMCAQMGIDVCAKSLIRTTDGSRFEPLIGNPGDGSSPSCAIVDEFHEHDTADLYDTMVTGMGAREQPLLLVITTSGVNLAGPCYDKHMEVRKMLDGAVPNDELFGVIYSIDEDDDWADPKVLIKANPNYDVSVDGDFLLARQREAVMNPQHQNRFKTKHLNIWCSASVAWMNMQWWNLCADPMLSIDEFAGEEAWFSLDLASKIDICAFVQVFVKRLNGQNHYYVFGRYYLPEQTINETKVNQGAYRKWVALGQLTPTDGAEVDFDFVKDDVLALSAPVQVREIVYDPWRATHLAHQLTREGAVCVEMSAGKHAAMSQAMDEITAACKTGRLHHDGNEVLAWMISNVVRKERNGMGIPHKEKPEHKIDGAIALMQAISRCMLRTEEETSHGFIEL